MRGQTGVMEGNPFAHGPSTSYCALSLGYNDDETMQRPCPWCWSLGERTSNCELRCVAEKAEDKGVWPNEATWLRSQRELAEEASVSRQLKKEEEPFSFSKE